MLVWAEEFRQALNCAVHPHVSRSNTGHLRRRFWRSVAGDWSRPRRWRHCRNFGGARVGRIGQRKPHEKLTEK